MDNRVQTPDSANDAMLSQITCMACEMPRGKLVGSASSQSLFSPVVSSQCASSQDISQALLIFKGNMKASCSLCGSRLCRRLGCGCLRPAYGQLALPRL
eukprot:151699-Pleurochrysis_carterae.AAC.2